MALDLLRANWTPGAKYLIPEQFKWTKRMKLKKSHIVRTFLYLFHSSSGDLLEFLIWLGSLQTRFHTCLNMNVTSVRNGNLEAPVCSLRQIVGDEKRVQNSRWETWKEETDRKT
jgi:hypothetical protein